MNTTPRTRREFLSQVGQGTRFVLRLPLAVHAVRTQSR